MFSFIQKTMAFLSMKWLRLIQYETASIDNYTIF